ncbi:MAG: hypothetical protein ACFCVD_10045 [Nodosilinea sp.]
MHQKTGRHPLFPRLALFSTRRCIAVALPLALGGGSVWLPHLAAPPAAVAFTSRVNLFLGREPGESFESFVQRSEIIARAAVQRSFDADPRLTDVVVTVVGESQEIAIPVMTVAVSRGEWQLRPDVQQWATYFQAARNLM